MGESVKYNGGHNAIDTEALSAAYELIPFCPEVAGGLPTPRPPSEITSHDPLRLQTIEGRDVTEAFAAGAAEALHCAQTQQISTALLKARSPSCGTREVYDGSFSGTLTEGQGVTTALLREYGVEVFDETEIEVLLGMRSCCDVL